MTATRTPAPATTHHVATLTTVWAALYGLLRLYWTLTDTRPRLPPVGDDLIAFSDWPIIALAATTITLTTALTRPTPSLPARALLGAAWATAALITLSAVLLLLDVVSLLLLNTSGIPFSPAAMAARLGALAMALGLAHTARRAHRRWIADCAHCGRTPRTRPAPQSTPAWAYAAAYTAIAGCLTRVLVQLPFGEQSPMTPTDSTEHAIAATGLLLLLGGSGVLLPLALVHAFGRTWPRWIPSLAGRRVPRPLVLGPALFATVGMNAYFGMNLAGLLLEGPDVYGGGFPDWFWWAAIGSYLVWGLGLAAATVFFARRTRPACDHCHRH
ncbi:hypothetical protein DFP74_4368 [Nocardiopsis sp. Huas11]|uniref:hypothetical protein n=1 Tax=Nocardiopsis sp. Huas11 TaxID=2183912 RepID=UPI000EB2168E|nr:hypothetical protein [Nocardiopsis sp. Huas11]RKS08654.1 hypothetical protein DFP74_4368 [Nocardiopsis sp. Huas11]